MAAKALLMRRVARKHIWSPGMLATCRDFSLLTPRRAKPPWRLSPPDGPRLTPHIMIRVPSPGAAITPWSVGDPAAPVVPPSTPLAVACGRLAPRRREN